MVITVKLFGMFQLNQPDYDVRTGLRVELPEGACVKDLLVHLGVSESQGALIWVEGKHVALDYLLVDNLEVKIMQVAFGG
jgi:sulfur carrier protein ThiS